MELIIIYFFVDMKTLDIDILNEDNFKKIGQVQINDIGQLSPMNSIKKFVLVK